MVLASEDVPSPPNILHFLLDPYTKVWSMIITITSETQCIVVKDSTSSFVVRGGCLT